METAALLLRLALLLVAARLAAEAAERVRIPGVLAEIAAGLILGPSALGLAHADEPLKLLAELGAVLLLFEVGLHMSLPDLRSAGGPALRVAVIGVAVPFLAGWIGMRALGVDDNAALFIAAGITATSVGITARVFADLHILTGPEARIVLGAAVADDVIGLVILAVVSKIGGGEALDAASLIGLPLLAIGFVVGASLAGSVVIPRALAWFGARARTDGTMSVAPFAVALAFGGGAAAAGLAPIVGAFVGGVTLAGSPLRDDVARRLSPVGHVLVPLFFVSIGVGSDITVFADPWVLGIGGALTAIAITGKIVSGFGVRGGSADRLLVGIGMIPRGEVGLIFASLGLARGVLDSRTQAVLLLSVFVTTIMSPPLIRRRVLRATQRTVSHASILEPPGGWLSIDADTVDLSAEPPAAAAPAIALEAALACEQKRPGQRMLEWLGSLPPQPVPWDETLRARFDDFLLQAGARGWRLLEITGMLGRLVPEIDDAIRRRRDPHDLDPSAALRFDVLERLRALISTDPRAIEAWELLDGIQPIVLLAALIRDTFPSDDDAAVRIAARLGSDAPDAALLRTLHTERRLLARAIGRPDEESVLELAAHLADHARADALWLLARAATDDATQAEALDELHALVRDALEHPELTGAAARDLIEAHRAAALTALESLATFDGNAVRRHLNAAPRRYLLAQSPATIARHLRMTETPLRTDEVRIEAEPDGDTWRVHVALLDRRGVLAALAVSFAAHGVSIDEAACSTWNTGLAIDVFRVRAPRDTDWDEVAHAAARALEHPEPLATVPIEGSIEIDNDASPWHSLLAVRATDRSGLLARVSTAFAQAGIEIHHASIATRDGLAVDTFLVTRGGHKLDGRAQADVHDALAGSGSARNPVATKL